MMYSTFTLPNTVSVRLCTRLAIPAASTDSVRRAKKFAVSGMSFSSAILFCLERALP